MTGSSPNLATWSYSPVSGAGLHSPNLRDHHLGSGICNSKNEKASLPPSFLLFHSQVTSTNNIDLRLAAIQSEGAAFRLPGEHARGLLAPYKILYLALTPDLNTLDSDRFIGGCPVLADSLLLEGDNR